jgi:hypothetical protein
LNGAQVLGETDSVQVEESGNTSEIEARLEAPYDWLEICISKKEVELEEAKVFERLQDNTLSEEQVMLILNQLKEVKSKLCPNDL